LPGDPTDRLIAATARVEGLKLVTRDRRLRASRLVETVW
jgi:PIN domain nuclease of toxin-antitoxin system